jgi:hypothetical protein
MKKLIKRVALVVLLVLTLGLIYIFTYVPPLSEQHGVVESKLYLGDADGQPLIVAFGGGGGGNEWARDYPA